MTHIIQPLAATLLLLSSLFSGCGLVTAPVSVPGAIAANANFTLKGPVVDSRGNPLSDVILSQELHHRFWTPVKGYAMTNEHKTFQVDKTVEVNERGSSLSLTFMQTGYHYAEYTFRADQSELITTPHGSWQATPDFPVVLYPKKPDAPLKSWKGTIDYSDYGHAPMITLMDIGNRFGGMLQRTDPQASPPAGTLYLTLTTQAPEPKNARGEVDPVDVNLPAEITLHISGSGNGLIPIRTKTGFAPLQSCDTAPTEGYSPALTIDRARLKEMRQTSFQLVTGPFEYFFFRVNGHYGKGFIAWRSRMDPARKEIEPTAFYFGLWLQPNAGDVDLTSFSAKTSH